MSLAKDTKILIIGAKGMLGQDLALVFNDYNLTLWDKDEIDITDEQQVDSKIKELNPNIIINCAAYTDVDGAETNQAIAMQINAEAVGFLAKVAKEINATILHISTDYIFDGTRKQGYTEDFAEFKPLNVYGESKLKGEELLKQYADNYYIIRTAWLYGKNGNNFVETMLKLGHEKDQLKVVNDQYGKPTFTIDLAQQIRYILDNKLPFGIYHITNETTESEGISWYEFAQEIFEQAEIEIDLQACSSDEFPRPAKRPPYSSLISTKLPQLRKWEDALEDYLANS